MKKVDPRFAKFVKTKSNAAVKEEFKQEKRKYKKERAEFFEKKKKEAAQKQFEAPTVVRENVSVEQMPLNKYLAHGGISSRREAAEMIKDGKVKVNGQVVTEPGYKMANGDEVIANGKKVAITKNLVYILMNKPKDYITTTDDPQKRKTVLDIIKNATKERVYPVGRLDRNTSGVLLITNDGELAQKLTHPSNEIKKIYAVTLNKPLERGDFDKILKGVTLEDGPAHVDVLAYSDANDKTQVGVEIHSGRNRIVRRIFESLGYDVKNLDRVMFAGLTKKNVERGKFRFLSEKEVRNLKYFGKDAGKVKSKKGKERAVDNNDQSISDPGYPDPELAFDKPATPRPRLRKASFQKSGARSKPPFDKPATPGTEETKSSYQKAGDRPKSAFGKSTAHRSQGAKSSYQKTGERPKSAFGKSTPRSEGGKESYQKAGERPKSTFGKSTAHRSEGAKSNYQKAGDRPKSTFGKSTTHRSEGTKSSYQKAGERPKSAFDKSAPRSGSDKPSYQKSGAKPKPAFGKPVSKGGFQKSGVKPKQGFGKPPAKRR